MSNRAQGTGGFSLLELMTVIGLMGIIAIIAVPTISGYLRTARLSGASNTLEADLHSTRARANEESRTYKVLFRGTSYSILCVSPATTILTRAMPTGVACSSADTASFFGWGLTSPATITLSDSRDSAIVRLATNGNVTHG